MTPRKRIARVKLPEDMHELCALTKMTPERVLTDFINNLLSLPGSHGADERMMARDYFLRTAIGRYVAFEHCDEVEAFLAARRD